MRVEEERENGEQRTFLAATRRRTRRVAGTRFGRTRDSSASTSLRLPDERGSERFVEYRVDDRVYRRRHVSQPEADFGHVVGHRTVFFRAHGEQDVQQKERRPAQHEREEHHSQHFAGLLFGSDGVGGRQTLPLLSVGEKSANNDDWC